VEGPEVTSDLAAEAGRAAIASAGISDFSTIDLLLVATGSPDMLWPSTACVTQAKLGLSCPALDLSAACSGFVYGLAVADAMVSSGHYRRILLIGADALSKHVNWQDRATCVLFGDGAGAAVVEAVEDGEAGIVASLLGADGTGVDMLKIPAGGNAIPFSHEVVDAKLQYISMNGKEVFKFAVRATNDAVRGVLGRAGVSIDEIRYLLLHQANQRITTAAAESLGLPTEKVAANIDKYGNTSAASIPLLLDELSREGKLEKGDLLVLVGFGAGLTWGANVVRWTEGGRS